MSLSVVREPNGHWVPGQSGNVAGVNQHSPEQKLKRRLAKAIERRLEAEALEAEAYGVPPCTVAYAEDFIEALKAPREGKNLEFIRLHLPKDVVLELLGDQRGAEETSQTLLDGLAAEFGSEVPRDARLVGEGAAVESGPDEGAP